ncbi:MAG TPA: hypothetical protein DIW23_05590 [Anaerolineae bacterium]|nr:hypothetical protein [Anaerolineae bacterium]HRJ75231.1 hypothetical protein [Anaerolineales bacterium]
MSSEERRKILQMVADGKISAEEAATLMRALDEDNAEDEPQVIMSVPIDTGERSDAPELEQVRKRAGFFSNSILGIGILSTVLFSWILFSIQQNAGLKFWFYCFSLPLFFGILLIVLGVGSKNSRWIYVNVDRTNSKKDKDGPRKISIAFPLPIKFAGWFIKNFGSRIDGLKNTNVDDVVQAIAMANQGFTDPIIVHVDDREDGEKVQVFIG